MAIKITDKCFNCGACEPVCPNHAIYEGGVHWVIADGTTVKGLFTLLGGTQVAADQRNAPLDLDVFYITPDKCTQCQGFYEKPQCANICPIACCVLDDMHRETVEQLLAKRARLHA